MESSNLPQIRIRKHLLSRLHGTTPTQNADRFLPTAIGALPTHSSSSFRHDSNASPLEICQFNASCCVHFAIPCHQGPAPSAQKSNITSQQPTTEAVPPAPSSLSKTTSPQTRPNGTPFSGVSSAAPTPTADNSTG